MDQDNNNISITICGDGGCGKSSITLQLVRGIWTSEYDPTIEDSYSVSRIVDGSPYNLQLTDTAGQEEYRSLWATSNLKSDAFLLVYDITSPLSLEALEHFHELIEIEGETRMERGALPPVVMVGGNKCDLKSQRLVSAQTGLEWARSRGCAFMETSAKEMVNIEATFAIIVRRVVQARIHHLKRPLKVDSKCPLHGHAANSSTSSLSSLSSPPQSAVFTEKPHMSIETTELRQHHLTALQEQHQSSTHRQSQAPQVLRSNSRFRTRYKMRSKLCCWR